MVEVEKLEGSHFSAMAAELLLLIKISSKPVNCMTSRIPVSFNFLRTDKP